MGRLLHQHYFNIVLFLTRRIGFFPCDRFDFQVLNSFCRSQCKDFSSIAPAQDLEGTSFVRILNHKNQLVILKKSSVVWFLETGGKRLSYNNCVRVAQTGNVMEKDEMLVKFVGKQNFHLKD